MYELKSRFASSKLGLKLRDVRSAVFPSEVQKGKRPSKGPSLSGNEQNHFFGDGIDSNETSIQPWMVYPNMRASEEEPGQTQYWRSSVSDPGTPSLLPYFEQITAKKHTKTKLLFDQIRFGATQGIKRQGAPQGAGSRLSPIVRDYGAVRNTCSCGGKCAAGSSGSSRRSTSSYLSPRRSGSTRDGQSETLGQHRLPPRSTQFRSRLMKLPQLSPRRRSQCLQIED